MKQTTIARTTLQLAPEEIALLQTIAQSQTNMAYSARSLLYLAMGQEFEQNLPPLPDELMSANWQMLINYKQGVQTTAKVPLNISPNPAKDEVFIHFQTENAQPHELLFYDMTGKLINTQRLFGSGIYNLSTTLWNNGIYYYYLVKNDAVFEVGKLIIIK
ncbi:MAG: T9SS type A sorting domain-containing protein [Sphingobacteriales bacterium]|nr:MAG: T9SS type A sorting domain-containing protein [Sphingobacteriales bacterium]